MQNNLVESLQRDNARLTAEIKFLEDTNYNLQVRPTVIVSLRSTGYSRIGFKDYSKTTD